jgi:hypothetical protein
MEFLRGISRIMQSVSGSGAADDFTRVGAELVQLKAAAREEIHASTAEAILGIIQKLENNVMLHPDERQLVGLWVVGDAEGYTRMENDLEKWRGEFHRLSGILESFEGQSPSPQSLVEVHGVLEDAVRLTADISHFLEKKERVERFNSAINNLGPDDARFIASMLKSMLNSEEM